MYVQQFMLATSDQHMIFFNSYNIMSISADIYHLLFSPPPSEEVASRLVQEEGGIQARLHAPLELYHRQSDALLSTFSCTCKTFNADQPIDDLVSQG